MALPILTPEQRAAALAKGAAARKERADVKNRLKRGTTTITEVLTQAESDEVLAKMKVSEMLKSMPGVGKIRAAEIMVRLDISGNRRLRGLGSSQRSELEQEFATA
jgi:transposase